MSGLVAPCFEQLKAPCTSKLIIRYLALNIGSCFSCRSPGHRGSVPGRVSHGVSPEKPFVTFERVISRHGAYSTARI
jgi:hypothetical protein